MNSLMDKVDCQLVAGFIGAQVALLINPLEIAKTRLQLIGEEPKKFSVSSTKSNSSISKFASIWKAEGTKVFTKGLGPSALHCALTNISSLHMLKYVETLGIPKPIKTEDFALKSSIKLASIIGLPAAILPSPLNLAKIRIQSKTGGYLLRFGYEHHFVPGGTIGLLRNIYETEVGPWALYRAALSSYIKFVTMTSVAVYSYAKLRRKLEDTKVCSEAWMPLLSSIAGAITGAFVAAPLDLISTRLYNQGVSRYGRSMQYMEYKDCLYQLLYKEGLLGIYKYSLPATVTLAVHSAVALYLWDHYNLLYHK